MPSKLAIVYYSSTGATHAMAERAAETAEKAGADVRLRHVEETAPEEAIAGQDAWLAHRSEVENAPVAEPDDLAWADVVLMGTPTRFGSATSQLQAFIDTLGPLWQDGGLADKVYAGFTSSQTEHGGQETTLLSLYTNFMHWGGIIVAPGYTDEVKFADGNPYGASKVTGDTPELEQVDRDALDHLVTRVLDVAERLAS
ncbi:MAG TPA: NAD(P)H:quinone oxidoreductase [Nocardioides sp.]|uniref:NAD(P)H:quinone oxidoreductase n=1 Tax=uncultured Nocardioides sp. TaxID=198441 RepID=UPI000EBD105D|nr:NAD(P)H:quinone oxidoreductase [uncultured Nocardioides sp.]HCB07356.1 NAD(P)H dehydrogenase [Nocardioides sp.]HRD60222.1 NAD(P)H:quinone oxidoreductase [Nocardioides sp.]HRI94487.1 NAD(P)H:quinone oxidoreductase [Nocardioides sp.]HRK44425.1 NAD(P)H:quinone oxidoreductase [Nocardioides sp.]